MLCVRLIVLFTSCRTKSTNQENGRFFFRKRWPMLWPASNGTCGRAFEQPDHANGRRRDCATSTIHMKVNESECYRSGVPRPPALQFSPPFPHPTHTFTPALHSFSQ